jgi:hypothetical protein
VVARGYGPSLNMAAIMGRLQGESCCPEPERGNPSVRDEMGRRRQLTEPRNEGTGVLRRGAVTATPRCPPIQLAFYPNLQRATLDRGELGKTDGPGKYKKELVAIA